MELKAGTIQYDLLMLDASQGEFILTDIGFLKSNLCTYSVYPPVNGVAEPALTCKLKNVASAIQNKFIYLNKVESGEWACSASSDIRNDLIPEDCV